MRRNICGAVIGLVVISFGQDLNGSYSVVNPSATAQILYTANIDADGTTNMGEDVAVEVWHQGCLIDDHDVDVGENSETWNHSFSPPPLYWTPVGNDWQVALRNSAYELIIRKTFTIIDFGA
jgi:hypothetical protein